MSQQDCKSIEELLPAYSAGATTPEENARVEAHLLDCPEAIDELTDYLMLSDVLRDVLTSEAAPPSRRQHVQPANGLYHTAAPPTSQTAYQNEPAWRKKLRTVQRETPAQTPDSLITFPSRWMVRVPVAASVLMLLIVGISSWYWSSTIQDLQADQARLVQELTTQRTQPLLVGEFVHRTLPATDDGVPDSHAMLVWDSETFIGSLYAEGLPELEESHHYNVWGVRDGVHTHLGFFNVDANGEGILLFQADTPLESFDAIGINIEPLTSRDTPTTPHLIIGEI